MAHVEITKGATSQSVTVFIMDSSSSTGAGLTGLTSGSAGLTAYYWRQNAVSATAITLASLAANNTAYTSGGFREIDATNMPGVYRLDIPDAAVATGVNQVTLTMKGATNMVQTRLLIELTSFDKQNGTNAGLSAIPNAAAGVSNGLLINGSNSGTCTLAAFTVSGAVSMSGGVTMSSSTGTALTLTSSGGNGSGLAINSNGSGNVISMTAGATGNGISIATTSGHGMLITPGGNAKHGIAITMGAGNNAHGIQIAGATGTGACHGIYVVAGSNAANSTGAALKLDGSVAGIALAGNGGSTSGDAVSITTTSGHGLKVVATGTSKNAIDLTPGSGGVGFAGTFSTTTMQSFADETLKRSVSTVEASAAEHSMATVILASLEMSISGTTMTIKRTDGATTHFTKTLTNVAGADPIRGVQ